MPADGSPRGGIPIRKVSLPFANDDVEKPARCEAVCHLPASVQTSVASLLKDPRDLQLVEALLAIAIIVIPTACSFYFLPDWRYKVGLGLVYVPSLFLFFGARFILALHYWSHAPMGTVWNKDMPLAYVIQALPTMVLAPFFGIPSGLYHLHHIAMHHRDNNVSPYDLSSTMPYQRDSLLGFFHYWARFTIGAWVEVPAHSFRSGNMRLFAQAVSCSVGFFVMMFTLFSIDAVATTFAFFLPFVAASILLMFGNWCQHIFVDPKAYDATGWALDPEMVNYALTFNAINSFDNALTFNDGYHIVHHRWASLHWSEMPQRFMEDLETHARHDAFVFAGVSPFDVGIFVMTGNLAGLAKTYVHYGQTPAPRTEAQIIAEFKRRLVPIRSDPAGHAKSA